MTGIFRAWTPGRKNSPGWVEDDAGCHIWTGNRGVKGYGRACVNGRKQYVHRIRYEREIGPVPNGMDLDHYVCGNGAGGCCNPHHCRPATRRENSLRSNSPVAFNAAKTHCLRGHPLSGDNLRPAALRRGERVCAECRRLRARRSRRKLKDAAAS